MDNRKWQAAANATPPADEASPSSGYPTDGNPSTPTPATIPGARWFHQVGEEIRAVIEAAGLTPSSTTLTQLLDAIKRLITGGDFKDSVRAATTANITLSGAQTIDGVSVVAGDRVLVKDQSTGADNGIYVAASGAWSRATDADTGGELSAAATIPVEEGTANADTLWGLSNDGAIVIGTTALVFAKRDVSDASTSVKGKVQLATNAEAQALADALKAITPSTLNGAFQGGNQSLSGSGYQKLPGGLILQWGLYTGSSSADVTVTFPISFVGGCLALFTSRGYTAGSGTLGYGTGIYISLTQAKFRNSDTGQGYFYFAIGT